MRTQGCWKPGPGEAVSDAAQGHALAAALRTLIAQGGEALTVTTPASGFSPALTRQVAFLPQPVSAITMTRLQFDGAIDIGYSVTMDFVCEGEAAIARGDSIGPYEGGTWSVQGSATERYAGVTLARHVIATKVG